MAQPYVYAHPPGTAPKPPQGGGVAGVIVGPRFCVPGPVELAMVRDKIDFKYGNVDIMDVNGNILFQVKKPSFSYFDGRKMILLDGSGSPVLTMKEKTMTMHGRWNVFRGASTEECDLLYSVKSSTMQVLLTAKLKVFLGHNHEEQICDFIVRLMDDDRSCVVYAGESDAIVAQMQHMKHTRQTASSGLDNFSVTVNPNVDYAFIASLLVLSDVFNRMDPPGKSDADEMNEVAHGAHKLLHGLHHLLH